MKIEPKHSNRNLSIFSIVMSSLLFAGAVTLIVLQYLNNNVSWITTTNSSYTSGLTALSAYTDSHSGMKFMYATYKYFYNPSYLKLVTVNLLVGLIASVTAIIFSVGIFIKDRN